MSVKVEPTATSEPPTKRRRVGTISIRLRPHTASSVAADGSFVRSTSQSSSIPRYVHTSAHSEHDVHTSDTVVRLGDDSRDSTSVISRLPRARARSVRVPVGTAVVPLTSAETSTAVSAADAADTGPAPPPDFDRRETEPLSSSSSTSRHASQRVDSDDDDSVAIVESRAGIGSITAAAASKQRAIDTAVRRDKRKPSAQRLSEQSILPVTDAEIRDVKTDSVLPASASEVSEADTADAANDTIELPSDVQAAMELLRVQFPYPCIAAAQLTITAASTALSTSAPKALDLSLSANGGQVMTALGRADSASAKRMPPLILASQLYSIVSDRTGVDQQLDLMKRTHTIRAFKLLSAGKDAYGLVFVADLLVKLQSIRSKLAQTNDQRLLLDRFASEIWFSDAYVTDVHISKSELIARLYHTSASSHATAASALSSGAAGTAAGAIVAPRTASLNRIIGTGKSSSGGGASTTSVMTSTASNVNPNAPFQSLKPNDAINALIQFGVLIGGGVGDDAATDSFWFTVPDVGPLLTALIAGRKEILGILNKKRPAKEILVSEMKKRRLRCGLSIPFVLRDMLGNGQLRTIQTTIGPLIQLPPST